MLMPKYVALRPMRYLNRMLQVGDEFEPLPGDVRWATSRGRAVAATDEPARRSPGRPPKAKEPEPDPTPAEEPWAAEPTRSELLARAEELGVELPSGYVDKATLAELIAEAEKHAHEDTGRF